MADDPNAQPKEKANEKNEQKGTETSEQIHSKVSTITMSKAESQGLFVPKPADGLTKQEKDALGRYEYDKDKHQYDAAKISEVEKMTPEQRKAFADELLDKEKHRKVDSGDGTTNRGQGDTPPQASRPGDAAPQTSKPGDASAQTGKAGDDPRPGIYPSGSVDADFDKKVIHLHTMGKSEDKNHPQPMSAHDILANMEYFNHAKPTPEQVAEVYKLTAEEKFHKVDDFVDKHKGETAEQQIAALTKESPDQLTRENIERIYKDNYATPPEVANDGKSVTSVAVPGINGRINVTKEELQEYEKMQSLQKQYDTAIQSGDLQHAGHLNVELKQATNEFFTDAGNHNNPQIGGRSPEYTHEQQRRTDQLDQERKDLENNHKPVRFDLPKDREEAIRHGEQGIGRDGNPTPEFCRELRQLQETNPALYKAECQGATQRLIEMGVIPKMDYKYKNSDENVARVEGISAQDPPGFLIAIGETNHPGETDATYIYRDNKLISGTYKDASDRNKGMVENPAEAPTDPHQFKRVVERYSFAAKIIPYTNPDGTPLPPEQQNRH